MRLYLILFILVSCSYTLKSQTLSADTIYFSGAIMDQAKLKVIPSAKFRVNSRFAGLSDLKGKFSLWANKGDTITYSHVGYKDISILVSDSLVDNNYLFGVFMSKDTVLLQEVLVVPRFASLDEEMRNSKVNTSEYVRAVNNVNSATHYALTQRPQDRKMDAADNTKLTINNYTAKNTNRTFISETQMLGISTNTTLRIVKNKKRKRKMKYVGNLISDNEVEILRALFKQR